MGKVPEKYFPQLKYQLAASGLERVFYFSYDGSDGVIVEVERDRGYIAIMVDLEKAFWYCVDGCVPPPMNSRDFVMRDCRV